VLGCQPSRTAILLSLEHFSHSSLPPLSLVCAQSPLPALPNSRPPLEPLFCVRTPTSACTSAPQCAHLSPSLSPSHTYALTSISLSMLSPPAAHPCSHLQQHLGARMLSPPSAPRRTRAHLHQHLSAPGLCQVPPQRRRAQHCHKVRPDEGERGGAQLGGQVRHACGPSEAARDGCLHGGGACVHVPHDFVCACVRARASVCVGA